MKKLIILFVFIVSVSSIYSTTNSKSSPVVNLPLRADEIYLPVGKTGNLISLLDLSNISVNDFEKLSGNKMKFSDKVNFKIGQHQLKKNINYDGTFDKKSIEKFLTKPVEGGHVFSLGGLLLGLFLSLLGVLIAYVITSPDKKSRITWAWIGAAISFVIWGAVLL
jgi:hypothetical protein